MPPPCVAASRISDGDRRWCRGWCLRVRGEKERGMATQPNGALQEAVIHELAAAMRGTLLAPGDEGYDAARHVWNGMIDKQPALIARCAGAADVIAAVNFARNHGLLLSVRG